MSKKTIPFQMLKKNAVQTTSPLPETISALEETSVDQWVHQEETPAETAIPDEVPEAIAITISAAPNWFEAVKIGIMLPYLTVWVWTLGAAQKKLRLLAR